MMTKEDLRIKLEVIFDDELNYSEPNRWYKTVDGSVFGRCSNPLDEFKNNKIADTPHKIKLDYDNLNKLLAIFKEIVEDPLLKKEFLNFLLNILYSPGSKYEKEMPLAFECLIKVGQIKEIINILNNIDNENYKKCIEILHTILRLEYYTLSIKDILSLKEFFKLHLSIKNKKWGSYVPYMFDIVNKVLHKRLFEDKEIILVKIFDKSATSFDIKNLIDIIINDSGEIEKDLIEWLRAYSLILAKTELYAQGRPCTLTGNDWKKEKIYFPKLKTILENLECFGYITHLIWFLGGNCHFRFVDALATRNFIFDEILELLKNSLLTTKTIIFEKMKTKEEKIYENIKLEKKELVLPQEIYLYTAFPRKINKKLNDIPRELYKVTTQKRITTWLMQFESDEEKELAIALLSNLHIITNENVDNALIEANKRLRRKKDFDIKKTKFIPVGDIVKSGITYLKPFIDYNRIDKNCVLNNIEDLSKLEKEDVTILVFLDDVCITGDTFVNFMKKNKEIIKDKKVYLITVVGFNSAIQKIEKEGVEVISIFKYPEEDTVKHIFKEEFSKVEAFLKKYAKIIDTKNHLGYKDFGALVLLTTSRCFNNVLPIFWMDKNGWIPLFPRHSTMYKYYTS